MDLVTIIKPSKCKLLRGFNYLIMFIIFIISPLFVQFFKRQNLFKKFI